MNYNCHKIGGLTAATITGIYAYQNGVLNKCSFSLNGVLNKCNFPVFASTFWNASYIIPLLLLLIFSYYSSTLPDIDHPMSRLGKKHPHISQYINSHYGHRGLTHYPLTLFIIGSCLYLIEKMLLFPYNVLWLWGSIGFVVGYASHILLDTLNSAGVAWLMPFSKVRIRIPTGVKLKKNRGKIRVGWRYLGGSQKRDKIIVFCMCIGGIIWCINIM